MRIEQAQALLSIISDNPSIIMGDLNTIAPEDNPRVRAEFETFLQKNPRFKAYFKGRYPAKVIPLFYSKNFQDAKNNDQIETTAYTPLHQLTKIGCPQAKYDHILYSSLIDLKSFKILKGKIFDQTSDHYPIVAEIKIK